LNEKRKKIKEKIQDLKEKINQEKDPREYNDFERINQAWVRALEWVLGPSLEPPTKSPRPIRQNPQSKQGGGK